MCLNSVSRTIKKEGGSCFGTRKKKKVAASYTQTPLVLNFMQLYPSNFKIITKMASIFY